MPDKLILEWAEEIECPIIRQLFIDNQERDPRNQTKLVPNLREALSYGFKWIGSPQGGMFWHIFHMNTSRTYDEIKVHDKYRIIPDIKPVIKEPRVSGLAKFINKIENK